MMFGVASGSSVTNHASNHGPYTAEALVLASSNLHDKPLHLSCGFNAKILVFRDKFIQPVRRSKQTLSLSFIVSAIRNGNDETESTVGAYADDQSLTVSNNSEKEVTASSLYLSEDHSQSQSQHTQNQGNLVDKLKAVHMHALAMEQWNASRLKLCHRRHAASAANLIHYLALRSLDVDQLEDELSSVGLFNLETITPHVIAALSTGIQLLENLKSNSSNSFIKYTNSQLTASMMRKKVNSNRDLLIGPVEEERSHIMVTVGEEAIGNETFVNDIIKSGATVVRINCAHGDPSVWSEIIRRVKRNSQMLEKPCRILMDLAGPKLRTGRMKPGPRVMKISPKKNMCGHVTDAAHVWVAHKGAGPPPAHVSPDGVLYVKDEEFLENLEVGDSVRFSDGRGKQRSIKISNKFSVFGGVGFMAECTQTAYVEEGTKLYIKGSKKRSSVVVDVPPTQTFVRLKVGDLLVITRDSSKELGAPPRVSCSSGYLFDSVKPGEPIAFDDGKIWGVIKGVSISEIVVSITRAGPRGTKLGPEKSINIPESKIQYEGLTSKDIVDLGFVGAHADIVGVSFVRTVDDIILLRKELEKRKLEKLGVVLKIETKDGVKNLGMLVLEGMKLSNPLGVMIARGDLAVECGWEMMGDIQEQLLSICSAAHVPVIWATQVFESLVKTGVPTRAEITDVACGKRASCIMLNKGKHIVEAIRTLDTILKGSCADVVLPNLLS